MPLKLMYITNRPDIAQIAESVGVDRVFVDMEYIGKELRQGGMDTVQSHHTIDDIINVKTVIKNADILVRVNPIHNRTCEYESSINEIENAINAGADIVMLPYFKTVKEVETFISIVNGRAKTCLLVETPEAVNNIDDILNVSGIDEVFIGLNDLSLGYGKKFMFELLCDGAVEELCYKFRKKGLPYGFGGIASLGEGMLPSEKVIIEHYRLGSTCVILSRSFCDLNKTIHGDAINKTFMHGVQEIREFEKMVEEHSCFFSRNTNNINQIVMDIIK